MVFYKVISYIQTVKIYCVGFSFTFNLFPRAIAMDPYFKIIFDKKRGVVFNATKVEYNTTQ